MIKQYYQEQLKTKKEKSMFLRKVMLETGIGYVTFFNRIRQGNWTPAERFTIKYIIDNETWKQVEE